MPQQDREPVDLDVADTEELLHGLAPEWGDLYRRSRPRIPFLSYEWTAACWEQVRRTGTRPFVMTCRIAGRLAALAPLYLRRRGPFRELRFIAERNSDYLGFLCSPEDPRLGGGLAAHLRRLRSWDLALLRPLSDACGHACPSPVAGLRSWQAEGPPGRFLTLPVSWEQLLSNGPSQVRHTRRWARKFAREGGSVEHFTGERAAEAFNDVLQIESRSWKARQGVSWAGSPSKRAFLQRAVETVPGVDVWLARQRDRSVAYLLNLSTPERVMVYRAAYDHEYRQRYPGGVLHYWAIHAAWESGVREYDFLNGEEAYKAGWTNEARRQRYLAIVSDGVRGRAAFAALVAPRWFLRRFKAVHWARAAARRRWEAVKALPARAMPALSGWRPGVRGGTS